GLDYNYRVPETCLTLMLSSRSGVPRADTSSPKASFGIEPVPSWPGRPTSTRCIVSLIGRSIGPKMHAGFAELCLRHGKPVTPQVACVDPITVFREMPRKAIVPPAMFGNAMSKLNNGLGDNVGRRQPLANRNRGSIYHGGNVIVYRLHCVAYRRFDHGINPQ